MTLPQPGLCALAWISFAPLLRVCLETERRAAAARAGWLFGIAFYAVAAHWVYSTCRFAGIPVPVAAAAWLALSVASGLPWAALGLISSILGRALPLWAWPWACAILWTALEFIMERTTPGLGLVLLEYTQWKHLAWIQGASWAGPHGLAFLIIAWNALLAAAAAAWRVNGRLPKSLRASGIGVCLALFLWWSYGTAVLQRRAGMEPALSRGPASFAPERTVVVLQPNVDQYQKWDETYADRIRAGFDELLARAAKSKPDLVLWPESSLPGWLEEKENFYWVGNWVRKTQAYHAVGAMTRSERRERNSIVFFDPAGELAGFYHKRRRVPFGEFVPLRGVFEPFVGILAQMGNLEAGPSRPARLTLPWGYAGMTICFEAMFPELSRRSVQIQEGAWPLRLLVNVTNDGWYKDTWAPYQHFYANVFRAVENRVSVLRAANTGISGRIDPFGAVAARSELGMRGTLELRVPQTDPFPRGSFYSRNGDWLGWACVLLAAVIVGAGLLKMRRRGAILGS
ncbi:MAG: apolipoprotein N-acyltransferase [Elusimicrobia bacterium]|nr:apolipoprotein N-acyltransferase [Elusimicrobiota bacterium]